MTAAQKREYLEKSAGGTRPVEIVVEGGSMVPRCEECAGTGFNVDMIGDIDVDSCPRCGGSGVGPGLSLT